MTIVVDRDFARLQWQCRRGMLELDLLLQQFLEQDYHNLDAQQRQTFSVLLESPDQLLLEYLMGHTVPFDAKMADVTKRIRNCSKA